MTSDPGVPAMVAFDVGQDEGATFLQWGRAAKGKLGLQGYRAGR